MRFKKGTQVEVMEKEELPIGSWRPARIVEGNGHSYVVSYDNCYSDKGLAIKKVPRKLLRPCPPTIWQRGFVPGDIVEVFENNSWQLAEFSQTLEGSIVFLRLIGSSKKIQAHRCQLRIPCTWKDDTWIAFPKESVKSNNVHMNIQSKARNLSNQIPQSCLVTRTGDDIISAKYDACADQQNQCSKRMKKRSNVYSTPLVSGSYKKKRTMNESVSGPKLEACIACNRSKYKR
ncbi:hypothetical protein HPP92_023173 [Vanilla planifolia]|uniref:Agenet domain-containing protein n=1 Tax=Vanilla planifolia TaxID=51239 RepID=A0A835PPV1_VANPL|nr:hypothetical protein HPP92_023173 [Vanilla planifolia]